MKGDRVKGKWGWLGNWSLRRKKQNIQRKCVYIFGNLTASHKLFVAPFVKERMGRREWKKKRCLWLHKMGNTNVSYFQFILFVCFLKWAGECWGMLRMRIRWWKCKRNEIKKRHISNNHRNISIKKVNGRRMRCVCVYGKEES